MGCYRIAWPEPTRPIDQSQLVHGFRKALRRGSAVPGHRLIGLFTDTNSVLVHCSEIVRRGTVSLLRRDLEPLSGLTIVTSDVLSLIESETQVIFGLTISLARG